MDDREQEDGRLPEPSNRRGCSPRVLAAAMTVLVCAGHLLFPSAHNHMDAMRHGAWLLFAWGSACLFEGGRGASRGLLGTSVLFNLLSAAAATLWWGLRLNGHGPGKGILSFRPVKAQVYMALLIVLSLVLVWLAARSWPRDGAEAGD